MIQVKLSGGLGNQMFQYAFAAYLAEANGAVVLNDARYKTLPSHHGMELRKVFDLPETLPIVHERCRYGYNEDSVLFRTVRRLTGVELRTRHVFFEHPGKSGLVSQKRMDRDMYFVGWWQDLRYIFPVEERLKRDFVFRPFPDGRNRAFAEGVLANRETVSVHVRRGDYLTVGALNLGESGYYRNAMDAARIRLQNPLFVVFSDDIGWCRREFGAKSDVVFADWNQDGDSYLDLRLMSLCRHAVVANSTFSWWAAFLNRNPKKLVFCPERWNRSGSLRLAMPGWLETSLAR